MRLLVPGLPVLIVGTRGSLALMKGKPLVPSLSDTLNAALLKV